jgi:uncharacterized protein HemX
LLKLFLGFLGFTNWLTPLLIVGAIAGGVGVIYYKGYQTAAQKYELAELRVAKQALETKVTLWKKASERDQKQAEADAKTLDEYEKKIRKLQNELKDPDRPCLDANDTKRLRSLHKIN